MSSLSYRPEIDGLRAVAVIPVVLFHLGFAWINGGYFGVDVFFVISGFLITSIILKENHFQTFSYKAFWLRRIRRILPALLVMIIVVLLASYFIVFRPNLKSYSSDALSSMFSYANFEMLLKYGDYWGPGAETSPFLHSWSLSVEEQFYIFYPVLITILIINRINPFKILLTITSLSFALFIYCSIAYPKYGFYLLPTRAWELSCGGLLAVLNGYELPSVVNRFKKILPAIGILLILLSYFVFTGANGIGFSAILPVLGSMIIIKFAAPYEPVGRMLGTKSMIWIGKISYSLYLWHWPIIVLSRASSARANFDHYTYTVIILIIIICLSWASYQFVEKSTRKMKPILLLVSSLIIITTFIAASFKSKFVNVSYSSEFNQTKFYGLYYDVSPTILPVSEGNAAKRADIFVPERDKKFEGSYGKQGIISGPGDAPPHIVVMGDSHGGMWGKVLDEIGSELNVRSSFFTTVGNNPLFPIPFHQPTKKRKSFTDTQWKSYCESVISTLNKWHPKILIVSCKWSSMDSNDFANLTSLINLASLNKTFVLLINQPPIIDMIGDNNSAQYLSFLGFKRNANDQYIKILDNSLVKSKNIELDKVSAKHKNCKVINVNNLFLKQGTALIIKDNSILYYDDDHLSYQGTQVAKNTIKHEVNEILADKTL